VLRWTETDGRASLAADTPGVGLRVMEAMVGHLKGESRFDCGPKAWPVKSP